VYAGEWLNVAVHGGVTFSRYSSQTKILELDHLENWVVFKVNGSNCPMQLLYFSTPLEGCCDSDRVCFVAVSRQLFQTNEE